MDFVRANSIFTVIHQLANTRVRSDKHPAYASVASGLGPAALDDFYAPEINSDVSGVPGVTTPTGAACNPVRDAGTGLNGLDQQPPEHSVLRHVEGDAIINEIDGKNHLGTKKTEVPTAIRN